MNTNHKRRFLGFIGNFLEHYDNALFGLLAPFLAPLFFPQTDPFTALILTYGMLPLGFISRPLGALFFGWIGDRFSYNQALFCSLTGMAIVSISIGSLPLYKDIGVYAPLLLALGRMLQSFCSAGEISGGAIFVLESTPAAQKGFMSSLYDSSTVAGILVASGLVTLLSSYNVILDFWRYLYWLGGLTAVIGIYLRLVVSKTNEKFSESNSTSKNWLQILILHRGVLFKIILASGYSYTTYAMSFTLMNGFIPLITTFSKIEVMQINTFLLILDMLLLPCFGYLANKIGKDLLMFCGALCSTLSALPLFLSLENATLTNLLFIRLAIIMPGIAFSAPYYAWSLEKIPHPHRYLILAFGSAVGTQLVGTSSSSICLWLYQITDWSAAPAFYLMSVGFAACFVTFPSFLKQNKHKIQSKKALKFNLIS